MSKKSARNFFLVSLLVETSAKVKQDDIDIQNDDVFDGFTISRNDRLGDITSNFHLNSFSHVEVQKIKKIEDSDDFMRGGFAVIQHNHRGLSQQPYICRTKTAARLVLSSLVKEAHGKSFPGIKSDENINLYWQKYTEWLSGDGNSEEDEVHYWFFEN
jgi:hypothetical protein